MPPAQLPAPLPKEPLSDMKSLQASIQARSALQGHQAPLAPQPLTSSQSIGTSSQTSSQGASASLEPKPLPVLLAQASSISSAATASPSQSQGGPLWLVLDLFAGMDGLGHAMDSLGMGALVGPTIIVYLFEVDSRCRAVLSEKRVREGVHLSSWKDSEGIIGSVFYLVEGGLQDLLRRHPSIKHIFVIEARRLGGPRQAVSEDVAGPSAHLSR